MTYVLLPGYAPFDRDLERALGEAEKAARQALLLDDSTDAHSALADVLRDRSSGWSRKPKTACCRTQPGEANAHSHYDGDALMGRLDPGLSNARRASSSNHSRGFQLYLAV